MRYLICFCVSMFVIFYACSEPDDDLSQVRTIPVKSDLPIYHFNCDSITSERRKTIGKANIVNSEEDILNLYNIWNLQVPDEAKNVDYEKNTLLISFDISTSYPASVKYAFYSTEEYGQNKYNYVRSYLYEESDVHTTSENIILYYSYSGIIINKIESDSRIVISGIPIL